MREYIAAIKQVVGEETSIIHAPSGHMNVVFLVDSTYVFRFPKNKDVLKHQLFERDICTYLAKHADSLALGIPRPLTVLPDPHCFVYSYIPGHILSEEQLLAFSDENKKIFIQDMTKFIFWLGNSLSPDKLRELAANSEGEQIEHWEDYIARTVAVFNDQKYPGLVEVCQEMTSELKAHYPKGIHKSANRVIHEDLHMGNLLFNEHFELTGVIDFGGIMLGDLPCEFRHFYRLSPELAKRACEIYREQYDQQVDYARVEFWAKISETVALCSKIMNREFDSPTFYRAKTNLAKWYPDKNWDF